MVFMQNCDNCMRFFVMDFGNDLGVEKLVGKYLLFRTSILEQIVKIAMMLMYCLMERPIGF